MNTINFMKIAEDATAAYVASAVVKGENPLSVSNRRFAKALAFAASEFLYENYVQDQLRAVLPITNLNNLTRFATEVATVFLGQYVVARYVMGEKPSVRVLAMEVLASAAFAELLDTVMSPNPTPNGA